MMITDGNKKVVVVFFNKTSPLVFIYKFMPGPYNLRRTTVKVLSGKPQIINK